MKNFIITILSILLCTQLCFAVPNPKSWSKVAQTAKIKTVAKVTKIEINKKTGNLVFKTVTFTNGTRTFTGKCVSERKTFSKNKLVGGIYFNPKIRETVYVTISQDNGDISTYQPLKKYEINKFKTMPDKIKYNLGKAYIED